MKRVWNLLNNSSLWSQLIIAKYGHIEDWAEDSTLPHCIKSLHSVWLQMMPIIQWEVGKGNIDAWKTNWTGLGRLCDIGNISREICNFCC